MISISPRVQCATSYVAFVVFAMAHYATIRFMSLQFKNDSAGNKVLNHQPTKGLAASLLRRFPKIFKSENQVNMFLLGFVLLLVLITIYLFSQSGVTEVENPLLDPETGALLPQEI